MIKQARKGTDGTKDAAHHACLDDVQKSYAHRPIIFTLVPLGSACTGGSKVKQAEWLPRHASPRQGLFATEDLPKGSYVADFGPFHVLPPTGETKSAQ